ncbi:MAG: tripartite tricarboxylate transporter TctB family protein [Zoogloeaceae bacterium]|jgi:hypothetical protein|nr:tripartite tricarboxylate transporter TctB family protein [Zoogloeaceae bacterium]
MPLSFFKHQDAAAGSLFLLTGLTIVVGAHDYPLGSAMRMGAGYFPLLLGGFLAALGAIVLLRAVSPQRRHRIERLMFKPVLLIGAGVLSFAGLLASIGLAAATCLLVSIAGAAHHEFRWRELLLLSLSLALFGAGVFIWGLGLPLPLLPA